MPLVRQRPRLVGLVVPEGVVVHSEAQAWCVAVRRPTGEVIVRRRTGLARLPWLLRLWGLRELVQGARELGRLSVALYFSLQQAGLIRPLARAAKGTGALPPLDGAELRRQRLRVLVTLVTLAISAALGLLLLLLGPAVVCGFGPSQLAWGRSCPLPLAESLLGAVLVPVFLGAMGRMGPLRSFAGYHGALHRGLAAYDAGVGLDLRSALRCDFTHGLCSVSTVGLVAALLPWVARLGALIVPQLRASLIVEEHHLTALVAALTCRIVVALVAVALARELAPLLHARRLGGALGRQMLLPTVQEPSDEATEVVLAALRALASPRQAESEARARQLGWPSLAADACTRTASRYRQAASR